jgi:S1-C subfamily serine protease
VLTALHHKNILVALGAAALCFASLATAQNPPTPKTIDPGPVVVDRRQAAPQIITVLHRINGLKMLRLLVRSGERVGAIDTPDEDSQLTDQVHTNIIAGLALDDGQTIAAWLPEGEVEAEATLPFPNFTRPGSSLPAVVSPGTLEALAGSVFERPDITIVERDGKRHEVRYIGLDGTTGLSLLKLSAKSLPSLPVVIAPEIVVGQRLRLFSPEPVPDTGTSANKAIYVRIGETDGQIVELGRGLSGEINRIKIKSAKLSPSNIGGVAVNEIGQTVGIIESVTGSEANVLSTAVIRAAAKRVLARQASVPRPWLGISGEPVMATSLDRMIRGGWDARRAMNLVGNQSGILLTSVAPGSPAAQAALHVGDVIVSVNTGEVKSSEDFSLLLGEAVDDAVRFTIVRPETIAPESITVNLTTPPDRAFRLKMFEPVTDPSSLLNSSLMVHGIEALQLRAPAVTRATTSGDLLVIFVQPDSAAFTSGLRPGDVIEAINGKAVTTASLPKDQPPIVAPFTLNVMRHKSKLVFTVSPADK